MSNEVFEEWIDVIRGFLNAESEEEISQDSDFLYEWKASLIKGRWDHAA